MNREMSIDRSHISQSLRSWIDRYNLRAVVENTGTPVFIYSEDQLLRNATRILRAAEHAGLGARIRPYIPFFPNSNPHLVRPLQKLGMGVLLQLPSEHTILQRFGFDNFIASPGYLSNPEIDYWARGGFPVFLSSIDELAYLLEQHPRASINVRVDSLSSGKPGIKYSQLQRLSRFLASFSRNLDCFEMYCGSSNSPEDMLGFAEQVFMVCRSYFPNVQAINFAGGYGFDYSAWSEEDKHFDWKVYFQNVRDIARRHEIPDSVDFLIEPARDLLADVGVLVLGVKRAIVAKPGSNQLVTDGSRTLMPSAQYKGRSHNVLFLGPDMQELKGTEVRAALRGRGILRHDHVLPGEYGVPQTIGPGDYAVVLDVGAYSATQHMEFLNIPPAAEVLIEPSGAAHLISEHGDELDKWRYLLPEKKLIGPSD